MIAECRLCGNTRELQQSHIIPNFVIRWLKKSSATSFLRDASNPDKRIPDHKEELLCEDCEQKIGMWESKFASEMFYPFIRDQSSQIEYANWLQLFIMSISWRILISEQTNLSEFESPHQEKLVEVKEHWRQILNNSSDLEDENRSHYVCFLGGIDDVEGEVPESADFYFDRAIDATPVTSFGTYIYFKFPQMFFVSCIAPTETQGLMNGEVGRKGQLETSQTVGPLWGTFLRGRIDAVGKEAISESEVEKIKQKVKENPGKLMDSESMKTAARKYHRERKAHDPTDYLGEKCPVCGFKHTVVQSLPKKPVSKNSIHSFEEADHVKFADSVALADKRTRFLTEDSPQGAIILSTCEKTRVLALYNDIGYIVEEEILYEEDDDPKEVGKNVRDELQSLYDEAISNFFRGE